MSIKIYLLMLATLPLLADGKPLENNNGHAWQQKTEALQCKRQEVLVASLHKREYIEGDLKYAYLTLYIKNCQNPCNVCVSLKKYSMEKWSTTVKVSRKPIDVKILIYNEEAGSYYVTCTPESKEIAPASVKFEIIEEDGLP